MFLTSHPSQPYFILKFLSLGWSFLDRIKFEYDLNLIWNILNLDRAHMSESLSLSLTQSSVLCRPTSCDPLPPSWPGFSRCLDPSPTAAPHVASLNLSPSPFRHASPPPPPPSSVVDTNRAGHYLVASLPLRPRSLRNKSVKHSLILHGDLLSSLGRRRAPYSSGFRSTPPPFALSGEHNPPATVSSITRCLTPLLPLLEM
jgi:hypothetical protein